MELAQAGAPDLLDQLTQASQVGARVLRPLAGRYRNDPQWGSHVAKALDTPGWLESFLAELGRLLDQGTPPAPGQDGITPQAAASGRSGMGF